MKSNGAITAAWSTAKTAWVKIIELKMKKNPRFPSYNTTHLLAILWLFSAELQDQS